MINTCPLGQHDVLLARQEFQFAYEVFDDVIPEELFRRVASSAAYALLLFGMAAQVEQVANDLVGIVGFRNDGVFKGDSVILTGAAGDGNTLRGHHFERDKAK